MPAVWGCNSISADCRIGRPLRHHSRYAPVNRPGVRRRGSLDVMPFSAAGQPVPRRWVSSVGAHRAWSEWSAWTCRRRSPAAGTGATGILPSESCARKGLQVSCLPCGRRRCLRIVDCLQVAGMAFQPPVSMWLAGCSTHAYARCYLLCVRRFLGVLLWVNAVADVLQLFLDRRD